jgi:diaminopimelate epimerase
MSPVAVTKMHGTLNDFVILDRRAQRVDDLPAFARRVCDRRGGMGADGVIVLEDSAIAHARMRVINADGSEAEMCGNGMRCAIRYLSENGEGEKFEMETLAGTIHADVLAKGDEYQIRLNVGIPQLLDNALPFPDASYVVVGNPHVVIFVDSFDDVDLIATGQSMPDVNVHLALPVDEHRVDVLHHERGVGLTQACGTGSVACAAAAIRRGIAQSPVGVHVPGGVLRIDWNGEGEAYLTGPAVRVFDARI